MMDGHFVWIWIDTAQNASYKNITDDTSKDFKESERDKRSEKSAKDFFSYKSDYRDNLKSRYKRGVHKELVQSDLSDMRLNYLLNNKNDQFLLFNHQDGVESSKFKKRNEVISDVNVKTHKKLLNTGDKLSELPSGLLSIRPLPIRVDRHLVKAAVRLLVATLKVIVDRCPDWLLESIALGELQTSCWKPLGMKEFNFSSVYAR